MIFESFNKFIDQFLIFMFVCWYLLIVFELNFAAKHDNRIKKCKHWIFVPIVNHMIYIFFMIAFIKELVRRK